MGRIVQSFDYYSDHYNAYKNVESSLRGNYDTDDNFDFIAGLNGHTVSFEECFEKSSAINNPKSHTQLTVSTQKVVENTAYDKIMRDIKHTTPKHDAPKMTGIDYVPIAYPESNKNVNIESVGKYGTRNVSYAKGNTSSPTKLYVAFGAIVAIIVLLSIVL